MNMICARSRAKDWTFWWGERGGICELWTAKILWMEAFGSRAIPFQCCSGAVPGRPRWSVSTRVLFPCFIGWWWYHKNSFIMIAAQSNVPKESIDQNAWGHGLVNFQWRSTPKWTIPIVNCLSLKAIRKLDGEQLYDSPPIVLVPNVITAQQSQATSGTGISFAEKCAATQSARVTRASGFASSGVSQIQSLCHG